MANFFDQFDAPTSDVGQNRPSTAMGGRPANPNYFDKFDEPTPGFDWEDIKKAIFSGLVQGGYGVAALPGDVNELSRRAGHALAETVSQKPLPMPKRLLEGIVPTSQELMDRTGYEPYQPKTTAGKFAGSVAGFVPGAATFGAVGGLRGALLQTARAVPAGLASEAAGELTEGTPLEPWARVAGAIVGGGSIPSRAITPFPTSPERQAAVQALRNEGVTDLTAGQVTGSKPLRYLESETGGSRIADTMEHQGEQYTAAALRRIGVNGDRATPEVIDQAFHDAGAEFNRLSAGNQLILDAPFVADMRAAIHRFNGRVSPPNRPPIIRDYVAEMQNLAQAGGPISGEAYQSLRSRIGADARSITDPDTAYTLRDMQHALDDAMERSIALTNPADLGAFRDVRRVYRNLITMVPAVTGAGEDAAMGIVSPAKLRQAAVGQDRRGYARGLGDFDELARSGEAILRPLPNSGTASRSAARLIPSVLGGAIGTAVTGGPTGSLAGALAGAVAPSVVGRAILSRPGRAYLGNQLIQPFESGPVQRAGMAETYVSEPDRRADEILRNRALQNALLYGPLGPPAQ